MHVLGPLPRLYKYLVCLTAIVICVAGGAWAAFMLPDPVLVTAGASIGLAVGGVCAFLLLHEFHHGQPVRLERGRRTRSH